CFRIGSAAPSRGEGRDASPRRPGVPAGRPCQMRNPVTTSCLNLPPEPPNSRAMRHKFLEVCGCCLALALNAGATPSIITPPQNITVNNASDAAFTVVATNAATYQWHFQGSDLSGATGATLSLTNVNTNQAGTYTVIVSSG